MIFLLTLIASFFFGDYLFLNILWCNLCALYIGYMLGSTMTLRRCVKDFRKLSADTDKQLEELVRKIDWQLKVKGCDGLKDSLNKDCKEPQLGETQK